MAAIIEPLQATHAVFNEKTDKYLKVRPYYEKSSMRNKRKKLMADENEFEDNLDLTCAHIIATNKIAKKIGGRETITYVRDCLLRHSHDFRHNGPLKNRQHIFKDMVHPDDMHPASGLGHHLAGQKIKLQLLAADIEAMLLIRFLDNRLRIKGVIPETIDKGHDIYKLHPEAEDALISLRLALVG